MANLVKRSQSADAFLLWGEPKVTSPKLEPADVAYTIVKERGQPIGTRDLIQLVMEQLGAAPQDLGRFMAEIHTAISLDNRFLTVVKGAWGLREWQPRPKTRVAPASRAAAATAAAGPNVRRRLDPVLDGDEEEEEAAEPEENENESDWD